MSASAALRHEIRIFAFGVLGCKKTTSASTKECQGQVTDMRPRNLLFVVGLFGGAYVVLRLGNLPGDLGHTLFGSALCGPWG